MKILVTGSSGLVGSRFLELSKYKDCLLTPDYPEFDITNSAMVKKFVAKYNPDFVIHLAAYTNVSEGENQRDNHTGPCWQINVEGTKNLLTALPAKTRYIHVSTDMVFPGTSDNPGPYPEAQEPERNSVNVTWYGYTKGEAEKLVNKKFGQQATILRIIYPVRAKYNLKLDYLRKPLKLFDEGKLYPIFNDQVVSISFVDEICSTLDKIIVQNAVGVYHAGSRDTSSPFELISYLLEKAREYAKLDQLILIAGHYEGVDERVREHLVDESISIGDYVLTGGEIPAMVITDAVTRLIPGVLEKPEAVEVESFSNSTVNREPDPTGNTYLEYPQYTRPEKFKSWKVPEVLLSGNHGEIERWRKSRH